MVVCSSCGFASNAPETHKAVGAEQVEPWRCPRGNGASHRGVPLARSDVHALLPGPRQYDGVCLVCSIVRSLVRSYVRLFFRSLVFVRLLFFEFARVFLCLRTGGWGLSCLRQRIQRECDLFHSVNQVLQPTHGEGVSSN